MDILMFWTIMLTTLYQSGGDMLRQIYLMRATLAPLGPEAARQFVALAHGFMNNAAGVLGDFDSVYAVHHSEESEEEDFDVALCLVSKGQAVYEQALTETDPDALEDLLGKHKVSGWDGDKFWYFLSEIDYWWGDDHWRHFQEKADSYAAGQDLGHICSDLARLTEDAHRLHVSLEVLRSCLAGEKYQAMDKKVAERIAKIIGASESHLCEVSRILGDKNWQNMAASLRFLEEIAK